MRTRTNSRWLAAFILILIAPTIGLAQDADDEDSQADEALELAVQTVTGTRLPSGPEASPVFVLTREQIDARGLDEHRGYRSLSAAKLYQN